MSASMSACGSSFRITIVKPPDSQVWRGSRTAALEAAEAAGFDVLVTVDQNIPDQQNLTGRGISLVILCGPTNRLRDLEPLVPAVIAALGSIGRGDVVRLPESLNSSGAGFAPTN
jgi:hypothetical protein